LSIGCDWWSSIGCGQRRSPKVQLAMARMKAPPPVVGQVTKNRVCGKLVCDALELGHGLSEPGQLQGEVGLSRRRQFVANLGRNMGRPRGMPNRRSIIRNGHLTERDAGRWPFDRFLLESSNAAAR
jgi:hypothetical protein